MLHFEGDQDLQQVPEQVWPRLSDARFLAGCMPGMEKLTIAEAERVVGTLRPGFAFVRGTLEITLEFADKQAPATARLTIQGKGIGSSSSIEARLALTPRAGGSRLHWVAEVTSLGGLLKAVPRGLIEGAARKVIADSLANLEKQLSENA